jgi:dihydropteroate synthase
LTTDHRLPTTDYMFPARPPYDVPIAHGGLLRLGARPLIMGILNVTPDSFAEPGTRRDTGAFIDWALQMEADGADLIDIGGESTRPGAQPVAAAEELERVLPVMKGLVGRLRIPLSVDTYKAEVARAVVDAGAAIVNDVSGLRYEPALANVVAESGAGLVVMHTRGRPASMYAEATYADVVAEVAAELRAGLACATAAGVAPERVVVDPGIGFAKRPPHSYGVLARLGELQSALGRPVLVGPSRKSFMREAIGDRSPVDRDWGTAAAVTAAVLGGAHIVRVHAVAEMAATVRVAEEIRRGQPGPS